MGASFVQRNYHHSDGTNLKTVYRKNLSLGKFHEHNRTETLLSLADARFTLRAFPPLSGFDHAHLSSSRRIVRLEGVGAVVDLPRHLHQYRLHLFVRAPV